MFDVFLKKKTVYIRGGLGNQLFQYSYGIFLRKKYGFIVDFDISYYTHDSRHGGFMLDKLGIIDNFNRFSHFNKLIGLLSYRLPAFARVFFKINIENYKSCDLYRARFLLGYWQYKECAIILRGVLSSNEYFKGVLTSISRSMDSTIAVHVRRGDYLLPENSTYFGVCTRRYYEEAILQMRKISPKSKFLFFSDDPKWVVDTFADFIGSDGFELACAENNVLQDFCLIASAEHVIISNSTFSWWAAVLNLKDACTVIAPQPWLDGDLNFDPCFDAWVRIHK